jgi:hydroxymethylbilane synthase
MAAQPLLRIGTRGSPLALAQAQDVRRRLAAANGLDLDSIAIEIIKTSGDRIQDRPLSEVGGKGLFTKEIEDALIAGSIDLAVHSMKDVATRLPDGLVIAAMLEREDVRDAFLSPTVKTPLDLPKGATVGTSSLRRQAQILNLRPDLRVVVFRGNVETRLRKLAEGVAEATFLAMAGLRRLGLAEKATCAIPSEQMLPAVAQGAVGVEIRADDRRAARLLEPLRHRPTEICVSAERAFLARLDGSCRTPIAGLAEFRDGSIRFRGEILSPDGRLRHAGESICAPGDEMRAADDAARDLIARAEPGIFLKGGA